MHLPMRTGPAPSPGCSATIRARSATSCSTTPARTRQPSSIISNTTASASSHPRAIRLINRSSPIPAKCGTARPASITTTPAGTTPSTADSSARTRPGSPQVRIRICIAMLVTIRRTLSIRRGRRRQASPRSRNKCRDRAIDAGNPQRRCNCTNPSGRR